MKKEKVEQEVQVNNMILFWGENDWNYGFLSNFYPCEFEAEGYTFFSSEHYFMFKKAQYFNDNNSIWKLIQYNKDGSPKRIEPKTCKYIGRNVEGFNEVDWNKVKVTIMENALRFKFEDKELRRKLMSTGSNMLVEASPWDKIWGIGLDKDNPKALNKDTWNGLNLLGESLVKIRDEYRRYGCFIYAKV